MYTVVPARTQGIWSLAAICCLGILGFLIAATIVLALIPVYLPRKQATLAHNTLNDANIFYLQYSADANPATSQSGSLTNTGQIGKALGFGNDAEVIQGFVKTMHDRRRRTLLNRRQKRTPSLNIILRCQYKMKISCNTVACQKNFKLKIHQRIQELGDINNFPCNILTAGEITTLMITVRFVGVVRTNFPAVVVGYGAVHSWTFIAIQSGDFYDPATWLGGVVPFARCSIVISAGITVTIARAVLTFPLKKFDIYGILRCGVGHPSFQFNYATHIFVHSGGAVEDLTSTKHFLLPGNSHITSYSSGSFGSVGTVIQTYFSTSLGNSITINSPSGSFTCGILLSGSVLSFPRITFIAIESGGFLSEHTYLGGITPSIDICSDGCGVYIVPGVTLSTADLDSKLDIDIVEIDVALGATVELGTSGSNKGFRFKFPIEFNVFGALSFICSGGGIYIPGGHGTRSGINFFYGSSFTSIVETFIQIFDILTGDNIGAPFILPTVLAGPYFIIITIDGTIIINVINPSGSSTSSSTPAIGTTLPSSSTRTTTAASTPAIG